MKTILITGATSGIGRSTAIALAEEGHNLILCGRRKERLKELENTLSAKSKVATLAFDVRNQKEVAAQIDVLPGEFKSVDVLINNAGNAHGLAPIQDGEIDDWEAMIDINVKGLLYVTKAILPGMVKKQSGHIINIGSIAGREAYAKGNVYCASKFAVHALSESMRIDLNEVGVKVSEIKPGAVETEFSVVRFKGDQAKADKVYEGFQPLTPEDVAEVIAFVISRPYHVNIADLLLLPTAQAAATVIRKK